MTKKETKKQFIRILIIRLNFGDYFIGFIGTANQIYTKQKYTDIKNGLMKNQFIFIISAKRILLNTTVLSNEICH